MSYLSAKKIYPGNFTEALNGWYKNIDTTDSGSNDKSVGGPTSVLAVPGYRYFQQRGYAQITGKVGGKVSSADVIVPSPYRNDDTRTDITGMVISGSSTLPSYVYRAAVSVASGWDGRVASGIYAATGDAISFGRSNGGSPVAASGLAENCAQANIVSTVDGTGDGGSGAIFFAAVVEGFSGNPFVTASGTAAGGALHPGTPYKSITAATTYKVFSKAGANATSAGNGFYLSDADVDANKKGYIVCEVCYIQPDEAPQYNDIEQYIIGRTVS